jgi:hypothetical protein
MPIAEEPGRAADRVLLDRDGDEVARFLEDEHDGRRIAQLFELRTASSPSTPSRS